MYREYSVSTLIVLLISQVYKKLNSSKAYYDVVFNSHDNARNLRDFAFISSVSSTLVVVVVVVVAMCVCVCVCVSRCVCECIHIKIIPEIGILKIM